MSSAKKLFKHIWITPINRQPIHARFAREELPASVPTVILVHGLSVSSGYMLPTAIELAPYYRVYAPDLPGFGRSAKPPHCLDIVELADVLADWMQTMQLPPAIFLGNSMGCQIITHFALRHPEHIKQAILVSPTMDPQARTIHQALGRLLRDLIHEPPQFMPVLIREHIESGIPRMLHTLHYLFEDRIEEYLPQVHIPTLVVRGTHDTIVPQNWAEKVADLLPNSQLSIIEGAAHAINFNSPTQLVQCIRSFLAAIAPPELSDQEAVFEGKE